MLPIALAPILGHAFSPFLRSGGGKGLAVTLGVWIGLTVWPVPLAAVVGVVLWRSLLYPAGWAVMLALAGMLVTALVWFPQPWLIVSMAGHALLLAWTHRLDLQRRLEVRREGRDPTMGGR